MANFERIEPKSEGNHVFDGDDFEDEEEEGSRLPLLLVIGLLVVAAFGGVVWLAYTQGVERGRADAPRMLIAAGNPPGEASPGSPLKIYEQPAPSNGDGEPVATAPPSSASPSSVSPPAPAKLAQTQPVEAPAAKPAVKPAAKVVAKAVAPPAAVPAKPMATRPTVAAPIAVAKATPAKVVVPPPAVATPTKLAKADEPTPAPTTGAGTTTPQFATKPPRTLRAPPAANAVPKPSAVAPAQVETVAPPVATAPAAQSSGTPAAKPASGAALQIGAYKSEADAKAAWSAYSSKHPMVGDYHSEIKKVDLGDKGVWYRLRMAGFADKSAAAAFCDKLKADDGNCFLAR